MNNRAKIYFLLGMILFQLISISCEEDETIQLSEEITFGIRHDRSLSDYEALATRTGDVPDFSSVVCFSYSLDGSDNYEFVASGTLIDEQWILTAGHNFFVQEEQSAPAPIDGIQVLVGNNPNAPNRTYTVEEIVFHPTWTIVNNDFLGANDLCLVKLNAPITDLTPIDLFASNEEPIGEKVWFCGFGDYSNLEGQDPDLLSKKHALENILDRKNDGIITSVDGVDYSGGLLAFDFDHPSAITNSLGDDIINEDEALLGVGTSQATALDFEATTVQGDSGGPLFVKDGDTWKLAGVLSGGASEPIDDHEDGSYGDISIFIRVSTHIDWIKSVVE